MDRSSKLHVAASVAVGRNIGATDNTRADDAGAEPTGDLAELLAAWRAAKEHNPQLGAQAARLLADGE